MQGEWQQPTLIFAPARNATQSASKQSTCMFTANHPPPPESCPLRVKICGTSRRISVFLFLSTHFHQMEAEESFFTACSKHSFPPLSPSLRVSYSVRTGGSLGTSVGQLSEERGGVGELLRGLSRLESTTHSRLKDLQQFNSSTQYVI